MAVLVVQVLGRLRVWHDDREVDAALLVSLQRHLGQAPHPQAVGDALLATTRPCTSRQAHGRPERCLNGYLDLPAAAARLFPGLPPLTHPQ